VEAPPPPALGLAKMDGGDSVLTRKVSGCVEMEDAMNHFLDSTT